MGTSPQLPTDNDGWFKRHIIEALNELKQGHRDMAEQQKEMHKENQRIMEDLAGTISSHEEADQAMFASFRKDINTAQSDILAVKQDVAPLKKIIYGTCALILAAVLGAWIASVVVSKQPNSSTIQGTGRN